MASFMARKVCVKCSKGSGQVLCGGCEQWFCLKHLTEHRQELSQQMDALTLEHDQLHQNLDGETNDQQHPLIARIATWESKSIKQIKQVANDVRLTLRNSLNQVKRNIQESLSHITRELEESRQMETYTELDLSKWMDQLKELREQLEKPSTIKMKHDEDKESSTHISLIQLRILQQRKGNDRSDIDVLAHRLSLLSHDNINCKRINGG